MKYRTHVAGGLALGYIAFNNIDFLNINTHDEKVLLIATGGLILGSLFPDIDHKGSYLSKKIKPFSFITSKILKHREYTHSIVGWISMSLLMYIILNLTKIDPYIITIFTISFSIGILSHILLDMPTYSGVALLYPFYRGRIKTRHLYIKPSFTMLFWEWLIFLGLTVVTYYSYKGVI